MLLALMFLLVCFFVGTVALGSATTSAQKLQGRVEDQQLYYAVSSAASLLKEALEGSGCTGKEWKEECAYGGCDRLTMVPPVGVCEHSEFLSGGAASLLTEAAWDIFLSDTVYVPQTASGYIDDSLTSSKYIREFDITAGGLPTVRCRLTMNHAALTKAYAATIELWPMVEGSYADTHGMTMSFSASVEDKTDTQTFSHIHPATVIGEDGTPVPGEKAFTSTLNTRTVAIVWTAASIEKGVEPYA